MLRRFNKRVQGAKILSKSKSSKYRNRSISDFVKKKNKLKSIEKRKRTEKLLKLGYVIKKKKRRF